MSSKHVLYRGAVVLLLSWLPTNDPIASAIENNTPMVTITRPATYGKFEWNSIVPYSITVVDHEDGNSAYDEIPIEQVLMSIRYLPDSSQLRNYLRVESRVYQDVLLQMSATTCFNCHQMKSKLIGPSFESISKKYSNTEASVLSLTDKVIKGTTGIWGDTQMPPHPDLKPDRVQQIVRWILKNGADPNQDHIRGVEGTFRTREKPTGTAKGVYVLTASYADTGDKITLESRKVGHHSVVLKSKY
ncbi:MAG: c-type cytochrome [Chryseolinea sp.]